MAESGRPNPGIAAETEIVIHLLTINRTGQYFPLAIIYSPHFYYKLIDPEISITCLCLCVPTDTTSQENIFPISIFHEQQLLDTFSVKMNTY